MDSQVTKKQYDSIQLMRGIAAVSVVFTHILMFSNGEFGVDLFFCISGFIMMYVTENGTKHFLLKRAIRIIPLYWLATFIISALLIVMPQYFRSAVFSVEALIKSMFFIPMYEVGASGKITNSLLGVGWTLILEVFFYLIFYVSALISKKYRAYIATAFLCALVLLGVIFRSSDSAFINVYSSPIMLEFAFGMFAYTFLCKLSKADSPAPSKAKRIVLILLAAVIWAAIFTEKYIPFFSSVNRVFKYGIPAIIVFILLFKGAEGAKIPKPLLMLGNISYSVYITHSFVVEGFSRLVFDIDKFSVKGLILSFVVVVPATLIVSYVSWYVIENKLTGFLRKKLIK